MSRYFILFALLAGAFACAEAGGGSGDFAEGGMGGTGISQGPITQFGSIFVNDIEWFLDDAEVEFDGETVEIGGLDEDDKTDLFNLGMVVRVEGTIDSNAGTGQAERVYFDDEIEGPVSAIDEEPGLGEPGQFRELTVLGQRILIEAGVTRFLDDDPGFGFDTIAVDDVVEISGLVDDLEEVVRATYVEKKSEISLGQTEVELKGTVSEFVPGTMTFMLGSVTVEFDGETDFSDLPGGPEGLVDGTYVEVEGTLVAADQIMATEIELEDDFDDDDVDEFSTTGFVNQFNSIDDFFVGNQKVDASGAEFKHGNESMLADGRRVEVEGKIIPIEVEGEIIGGILIAEEVEFEDQEVRVHAAIASIADLAGREAPVEEDPSFIPSLKLLGIEIKVLPSTRIELGLLDTLVVDDFLEVRGIVNAQGVITASRVELKDSDNIRLEGPVEQFASTETTGEFTILGVTVSTVEATNFIIGESAETREDMLSAECFFGNLNAGDFVEVEGDVEGSFTVLGGAEAVTLDKEKNVPTCTPPAP